MKKEIPTLDAALAFFKGGFNFFHRLLFSPKSHDEDKIRREFLLNVILFGLVVVLALMEILVIYGKLTMGDKYSGVSPLVFSSIFLIFLIALVLSRLGLFEYLSYLILIVYFSAVSFAAVSWGVDLPIVLLSYALLVVMSTILVSTRFGFFTTGIVALAIIFIGYSQLVGIIEINHNWRTDTFNLYDAFEYAVLIFMVGLLSWLSNREIERSLRRAHKSERELKEERDLLEFKVIERTKELKILQMEKISNLYRFVGFGRLALGLFHDLVNHLSSLTLHLKNLHELQGKENTESYLNQALIATKRIEDFLAAVRRQLSSHEVKEVFSLNKEIQYVFQLLSYRAKKMQVSIFLLAEKEVQVLGNPLKFHQIIMNLVSNALDAYQVGNFNFRQIKLNLEKKENSVCIKIQDWGKGIPVLEQSKIFDPFFTTKGFEAGAGLGLSTAKYIVEKDFRGKISVQSVPNIGSTFTIELPFI